jgi:hypothetical protein
MYHITSNEKVERQATKSKYQSQENLIKPWPKGTFIIFIMAGSFSTTKFVSISLQHVDPVI